MTVMDDVKPTFGNVLSFSLGLVARHWLFFLGLALCNVLLGLPSTFVVQMLPVGEGNLLAAIYGFGFLVLLFTCLIHGTLFTFVFRICGGQPASAVESLKVAFDRWPALVWTLIVQYFWMVLGFMLLLVPGVIWGYRQMLAPVVTVVEGLSGPAAVRRSEALVAADGSTFGTIVVGQWLLLLVLFSLPAYYFNTQILVTQPMGVRLGLGWLIQLVGICLVAVVYSSQVVVYRYLREKLDRAPFDDAIGFSPSEL